MAGDPEVTRDDFDAAVDHFEAVIFSVLVDRLNSESLRKLSAEIDRLRQGASEHNRTLLGELSVIMWARAVLLEAARICD